MVKSNLSIFEIKAKQQQIDNTQADLLAYRNTLQTVAQMRKLQRLGDYKAASADLIRLEAAVDMRLAELGIKAV